MYYLYGISGLYTIKLVVPSSLTHLTSATSVPCEGARPLPNERQAAHKNTYTVLLHPFVKSCKKPQGSGHSSQQVFWGAPNPFGNRGSFHPCEEGRGPTIRPGYVVNVFLANTHTATKARVVERVEWEHVSCMCGVQNVLSCQQARVLKTSILTYVFSMIGFNDMKL